MIWATNSLLLEAIKSMHSLGKGCCGVASNPCSRLEMTTTVYALLTRTLRAGAPSLKFNRYGAPSLNFKRYRAPSLNLKRYGAPCLNFKRNGAPCLNFKRYRAPSLNAKRYGALSLNFTPGRDFGKGLRA